MPKVIYDMKTISWKKLSVMVTIGPDKEILFV